jgi:Cdc6-like AAA superfamily ATPase
MSVPTNVFEPGNLDENHFVDRKDKKQELLTQLRAAVGDPDIYTQSYLVIGERGVGKSLFTRHVLTQLKAEFSGDTAFVRVDGAHQHNGFSGIMHDLLSRLIDELEQLDKTATSSASRIPPRIYDELRFLRTLLGYTEVSIKRVHDSLTQYNLKIDVSSPKSVVPFLVSRWGLEKKISDQDVLEMKQRLDISTMCEAVCRVLESLAEHRQKVVVFIDDLDQVYGLSESYIEDAETMFKHLHRVHSCILIVNLRDYYLSANTAREYHSVFNLQGLDHQALGEIVDSRLGNAPNKTEIEKKIGPLRDTLVQKTDNPLAFLTWCHWLINRTDCAPDKLEAHLSEFVEEYYTWLADDIRKVAALYKAVPRRILRKTALLSSLGADGEDILNDLEDREIVLPQDYVNRTSFRLNPIFHFLL